MVVCRPAAVIPANAGIQQHNAAGLYRKKPKPHRLSFPQKLESKNATQQEFIGKNRTPPPPSFPQKRESRPVGTETYRIKQFP
ncbi:hypothetical protein COH84_10305 [Neisseria meningitidis]|nr:hypothetical protein BVD88_05455 [Neisseria meningitidis]KQB44851.1 hypothetical protein LD08_06610 [Neisseria meningitidis]RNJ83889.1 hypothetical protein COI37_11170 [Neisseria meningitidis]RNJ91599.1 hypothetical protein COI34_06180 [Neisseria meningitidis]RNJ93002.1 hypothetical protein COI32_09640 [Neisseria meningitidis]